MTIRCSALVAPGGERAGGRAGGIAADGGLGGTDEVGSHGTAAQHGLTEEADAARVALVRVRHRPSRDHRPVPDRQIARRDPLDARTPVLVPVADLRDLPVEIRGGGDRGIVRLYGFSVRHGEGRSAPEAGAHAARGGGAGQHDEQIGAEARDLLLDGRVRTLPDGHHGDQRGDPDEHPQHGQRRAQLIAGERPPGGDEGHARERPQSARGRGRRRRSPSAISRKWRGDRDRRRCGLAAIRNDDSVAHRDDAVGEGGHVRLVCHQHDRQAALAIERLNGRHDLVRGPRVEVSRRLVRQQDRRIVDEGPRDRDPLLLAARQLAREAALPVRQPEQLERLLRVHGAVREVSRVEQRQGDVLDRARAREQVEILKDESDATAPDARERGFVEGRDVDRLEEVPAARRPVEAAEDVHQRRLAGAGCSHDRDELPRATVRSIPWRA